MRKKAAAILWTVSIFAFNCFALGENTTSASSTTPGGAISTNVVSISVEQQYEVVRPDSESALAIHFELKNGWHFYASPDSAPGGMNLTFKPTEQEFITFAEPRFPQPQIYFDETLKLEIEVFSGKFTVFLPFTVSQSAAAGGIDVKIAIDGAVCSEMRCLVPDFEDLTAKIKIAGDAAMSEPKFVLPDLAQVAPPVGPGYSAWFALGLALLAGLSLNIMPCIWPVLPLIVMRIVEQAKQGRRQSVALGLAFCLGILLFFACLAGANIILQLFYGTVLQWGDQFRSPAFVAGMALLLVVLALFMFGVFTVTVPSSIASKSGSGKGYSGAVGMGLLAAVLSTPCSFGILAAAFAWAQTQRLPLGTVAIMVIGVGMAVPYAILTSMPGLLKRLPKAGRWMELFKQAIGFLLLVIAVWLISVLPQMRRMGVIYFAVVLGFCVWMWGSWVSPASVLWRKWLVRIIAVVLVVAAGWAFLPAPAGELIGWQQYDPALIEKALEEQRAVLIKFTANWCLICKVVDKIVYSREDVANLIKEKDVLAIKADTTEKDHPATFALKNKYKEPGVPVSMLFVPGRKEPVRWREKFFADELKELLEKLPSK